MKKSRSKTSRIGKFLIKKYVQHVSERKICRFFLNSKNRFVIIDIKDILGPKNGKNFY